MSSLQPFAEAASQYAAIGLRPVPVGFDKRPAVRNWREFKPSTYRNLISRFGGYNVGALNGKQPLPITVVDIDDPSEREWCKRRFGDTPVKVRTPSGGEHWYYRGTTQRQIRLEGRSVDVLGEGGFGVLPPSHTPDGEYSFICGAPEAFRDLPHLQLETSSRKQMRDGDGRNKNLFDVLRRVAASIDSHDELLMQAINLNDEFAQPLEHEEVRKIVGSVWKYRVEGRLMLSGCESQVINNATTIDMCAANPDAFYLLSVLKRYHGAKKGKPFKLAKSTADKLGWTVRRFWRARDYLIEHELLELVQRGECGRKGATVVRLPA